ncbi:MAG: PIN domain-containing protein [Nitrospiria bacterium]
MPTGNLALLDTSVYIENFRSGRFTRNLLRAPWIIRCSAVVLHELRRGARTPLERRFVSDLARKVRIITPTEHHWIESGRILSVIERKKGYHANKLRDLAFDTLIALSAREIGATLITCNRDDFEEIRKEKHFKVLYL